MLDEIVPAASDGGRRYRLYVSYACPWSHRTLIIRTLLGLERDLPVVNMNPVMDEVGWRLSGGTEHLIDVYRRLQPTFDGRATVPLLADCRDGVIVSNESADIMKRLGPLFGRSDVDLVLPERAAEVNHLNDYVQTQVNEAVYRVGFSSDEEIRHTSRAALLKALGRLNGQLEQQRYLLDPARPFETDWRLWVTLVRYETAYRPLFLDNSAPPLSAWPQLNRFKDELMAMPGIAGTVRVDEIATHYASRVADLRQRGPLAATVDGGAPFPTSPGETRARGAGR